MSGAFIVRHGQIVAAHALARTFKVLRQIQAQNELRDRLASVAAAKAWNVDMATRKAAKRGKV